MIVRTALTTTLSMLGVKNPTIAQLLEALTFLSIMIKEWSADDLTIYEYTEESFALVVGQGSYTIGDGGDFDTDRPLALEGAYTLDGDESYPVKVIGRDQYNGIFDKTSVGRPKRIFYAAEFPLGKIYTDLVTDETYTLVLTLSQIMHDLTASNIDSTLLLPPNFEQAIIYNLAINMIDVHRSKLSQLTIATAVNSKDKIIEASKKPIDPVGFAGVLPGVGEAPPTSWTND